MHTYMYISGLYTYIYIYIIWLILWCQRMYITRFKLKSMIAHIIQNSPSSIACRTFIVMKKLQDRALQPKEAQAARSADGRAALQLERNLMLELPPRRRSDNGTCMVAELQMLAYPTCRESLIYRRSLQHQAVIVWIIWDLYDASCGGTHPAGRWRSDRMNTRMSHQKKEKCNRMHIHTTMPLTNACMHIHIRYISIYTYGHASSILPTSCGYYALTAVCDTTARCFIF